MVLLDFELHLFDLLFIFNSCMYIGEEHWLQLERMIWIQYKALSHMRYKFICIFYY